ncbi:MAG: hypothetical protein AB4057_00760 [Crocosphaera sp.]
MRTNSTLLPKLIPQYPTTVYRLDGNLPENAIGLVCQGLSCLEPAITEEQLIREMVEVSLAI